MTWLLTWLNMSIAILNATLQFLVLLYTYIKTILFIFYLWNLDIVTDNTKQNITKLKKKKNKSLRGCLDSFFDYLISITRHSSLNFSHSFGIINQFPSLNIFHTICGSIPVSRCSFFFLFVFNTQTHQSFKKKKKTNSQPRKRKKKRVKSCGWYCLRVSYVCLITILPLSYELWKLKTAKMCFQFP